MGKQLKLRAWDAEQNKMVHTFEGEYKILVNSEDGTVYCGGHLPNGDWNEPPLMEFTGESDHKHNEVYDGDLLKVQETHLQKGGIHVVHYWKGSFVTSNVLFKDLKTASKGDLSFMLEKGAEVIGNVYENPEYL